MAIKISELPTRAPEGIDKKQGKKELERLSSEIAEEVKKMYAGNEYNLLVVLQGMDSSGKDGVSRNVFSKVSPTMVSAYSFKKPTDLEFDHDFLWRVHWQSPAKGTVRLFVRSHYEDILIQRVHGWIDEERVNMRIAAINAYEKLLEKDNDTIIMKFFLNLSKERQKEKLIERIEIPSKNYKHNDGDWEERKYWDSYMDAYENALNKSEIPWIAVPSDQRWYRNYFVAQKVLERLKSLNLEYPVLKERPKII
ncbi:MAG: polyphosphate kinase [Saprospiraceae bacterium]|nr:polyphosphate kinase [Bacteroidia bacterium]MBT8228910.1 polyphosphate kinase [Bacteroidia bacterium]NNF22874.1 polyphosphate kinase [Saprospiraceae bacterium]NNK90012.1 polyphosphate kinase [Saprospiraceae bacterium]